MELTLSTDRSVFVDDAVEAPELKGKSSGCTACCHVISSLIKTIN